MFRPHDREYAEFGYVRFPPQRVEDARIFLFVQAVFGDDLRGDGGRGSGCVGHGQPLTVKTETGQEKGPDTWCIRPHFPLG